MGSYFGAELCDLISLYALNKLKALYDVKEIGLYRDNDLAIIEQRNNFFKVYVSPKSFKLSVKDNIVFK